MELAVFVVFAALALGSALVVVSHRDPVKSTLSLVVTLFSLAVLFVLLEAPFIATLQILVYTGAILVLFLFVLMLLNIQGGRRRSERRGPQPWIAILGAGFFGSVLAFLLLGRALGREVPVADVSSMRPLAAELMSRYLLPFEMVGLLLLAAVVGATILARRPPRPAPADGESR